MKGMERLGKNETVENNESQESLPPLDQRIYVELMKMQCPVGDDDCIVQWIEDNIKTGRFADTYNRVLETNPNLEALWSTHKPDITNLFNTELGIRLPESSITLENMSKPGDLSIDEELDQAA